MSAIDNEGKHNEGSLAGPTGDMGAGPGGNHKSSDGGGSNGNADNVGGQAIGLDGSVAFGGPFGPVPEAPTTWGNSWNTWADSQGAKSYIEVTEHWRTNWVYFGFEDIEYIAGYPGQILQHTTSQSISVFGWLACCRFG